MYQLLHLSFLLLLQYAIVKSASAYSLGIDFGTSGVRGCLIAKDGKIQNERSLRWDGNQLKGDCSNSWLEALHLLLDDFETTDRQCIQRICVSGTSATALMVDSATEQVSRPPLMYNYNVLSGTQAAAGEKALQCIKASCPDGSPTASSTSTLAKLLMWHFQKPISSTERLMHQADFIAFHMISSGTYANCNGDDINAGSKLPAITSDWHNALKLGFDVGSLEYPKWMLQLLTEHKVAGAVMSTEPLPPPVLPIIVQPGQILGRVSETLRDRFDLPTSCEVVAGTTDSIAAFLAAGVNKPGQAVTSLGSTLAIKALSIHRVDDSTRGIYSHRLGNEWLVGGASNVGCAILRQEGFTDEELAELSLQIDANEDSEYSNYYPLTKPGERFPFNDPGKQPILDPKPFRDDGMSIDRRLYLQGILQSIALIEKKGYDALEDLGATPVTEVFTAGGGSKNDMWTAMRGRILNKITKKATNTDAAYGCALLGKKIVAMSH